MLGMPTPLNISLVPLLPWCQGPSNFIPLQTFHPRFHLNGAAPHLPWGPWRTEVGSSSERMLPCLSGLFPDIDVTFFETAQKKKFMIST